MVADVAASRRSPERTASTRGTNAARAAAAGAGSGATTIATDGRPPASASVRAAVAVSYARRVGSPSEPSSATDQMAPLTQGSTCHEQVDDLAGGDIR